MPSPAGDGADRAKAMSVRRRRADAALRRSPRHCTNAARAIPSATEESWAEGVWHDWIATKGVTKSMAPRAVRAQWRRRRDHIGPPLRAFGRDQPRHWPLAGPGFARGADLVGVQDPARLVGPPPTRSRGARRRERERIVRAREAGCSRLGERTATSAASDLGDVPECRFGLSMQR
jgi:hypothetical protein